MAKVVFKSVDKIYDKNKIKTIDNLNLEIKDKEFLVLVGPSGCGKSTILRMIAGLESISTGELLIDNTVVNGSVDGSLITAGNWKGTFNFNIVFEDEFSKTNSTYSLSSSNII